MTPPRPRAGRPGLLAAALGCLLAAGCGQTFTASSAGQGAAAATLGGSGGSAGAGGQGGTAGSGGEGGALACLGGNGCLACLGGADCKPAAAACNDDPACLELVCCVRGCTAGDCVDACVSGAPDGFADAFLLAGCAFVHCAEPCAVKIDLSPCQECTLQTCEKAANACRDDAQCTIYYDCLQQCDGDECMDCDSGVGLGPRAAAEKLDGCRLTECSLGRHPTCVLP